GDEYERHVPARQPLRHRINEIAAEVDVENGGIERFVRRAGERIIGPIERSDDLKAQLDERVAHHHRDQRFVFHQQNTVAVDELRGRSGVFFFALDLTGELGLFDPVAARDRHHALQAFRSPIENGTSAELALDTGADYARSVALRRR